MQNIITSKFKEKVWCEKNLGVKRKLRYYKKLINSNLGDEKYLSVVTSSRKKINITKVKTNSHKLHNKTGHLFMTKTLWEERVCHLCDSMSIGDDKYFLLECRAYTDIRYEFHSMCYNTNISNLVTCQNYNELRKLLTKFF